MNPNSSIKTNNLFKKALAVLCVMFTVLGLFGYLNINPMNSNAATYNTYYCGMNGGSTSYYNRNVSSVSTSQSWLSYSCKGYGSYSVYVAASTYVQTSNQRCGYVYFRDSKGNLLNRITIYQTNPCISISTPKVAITNVKNGSGTITVRSNVSFEYSVTNDSYGRLCNTTGKYPNTSGTMKNYYITVNTKQVNDTGSQWSFNFRVKATKYSWNSVRNSTLLQNSTIKETPKYQFSGSYLGYELTFIGERPFKSSTAKTYSYTAKEFDMPAANFVILRKAMEKSALNNGIRIEMPSSSNMGKLLVLANGTWTPYASVTLHDNDLGMTVEPYGYNAGDLGKFVCDYKKLN